MFSRPSSENLAMFVCRIFKQVIYNYLILIYKYFPIIVSGILVLLDYASIRREEII